MIFIPKKFSNKIYRFIPQTNGKETNVKMKRLAIFLTVMVLYISAASNLYANETIVVGIYQNKPIIFSFM